MLLPIFSTCRVGVALVTGATGGLGRAIVEALAQHGARVVASDLDMDACRRAVGDWRDGGWDVHATAADLRDAKSIEQLTRSVLRDFGTVDILVHNAGVQGPAGSLGSTSERDWDTVMDINARSALILSRNLFPAMERAGRGSIVFLSSIAGLRGNRAIGLYGLSKGTLGRCVMVEFTDSSIQDLTNGVLSNLPLPTRHELFDVQLSAMAIELAEEALQGWPNGKLYYHGLCVAMVGVLSHRYVGQARCTDAARATRLASRERQRVLDLIEAELGNDLGLSRLATQAGLSPYHFARVFKDTFGTTPHKYVQQRRLEAAAVALRCEPGQSIADISVALGFSSQAHMTQLMRLHFGMTPGSLRRS